MAPKRDSPPPTASPRASKSAKLGETPSPAKNQPLARPIYPGPLGTPEQFAAFFEELPPYVRQVLELRLHKLGFKLIDLGLIAPSSIEANQSSKFSTFKERWNHKTCVQSLLTTGFYEAAGCLWWFKATGGPVSWQGEVVVGSTVDAASLEAARPQWDKVAFTASHTSPNLRRYNFPGVLPTATLSTEDAGRVGSTSEQEDIPIFSNLPMLAGRPMVLAMYMAFDEALEANDDERVLKLFEASPLLNFKVPWVGSLNLFFENK